MSEDRRYFTVEEMRDTKLSYLTDGDDYYCHPCGESFDYHEATSKGRWECPMCGNEELQGPHERPRVRIREERR